MKKEFGKHYLVELIGCRDRKRMFVKDVRRVFLQATSHFSIHTWPEDRYASVDIQTCGPMYPERAIEILKKAFGAKKVVVKIVKRGIR